jgi:hypothetical protein
MAACGMLAAGLVRLLAKHRREDVVKILLAVALFTGVLLTAKLRVVAVLPELVILCAALFIFQDFPGFGEIFKLRFGIVSLLTSG